MFNYDDKPIVACSTGLSENTAIGVVRLSGFSNTSFLNNFFNINTENLKPRVATFCKIIDSDKVIDEVVITFFKGPASYNGENILEIAAHGNIFNLKRIISLFINSSKFRMAGNGEFTYRALVNKKMNLAQVEGLDALINASSALMLDQSLELLNGKLFEKYRSLHTEFLRMKSSIEINIDFVEDVGEENASNLLLDAVSSVRELVDSLYKSATISTKSLLSPDIVLVGQPNSGKSSLFNLLLEDSRSIVSDIEGTTRDYITEYIELAGNSFRLVDTAGLRLTNDSIEEEGIRRSYNLIDTAFLKVLLCDARKVENLPLVENEVFDCIFVTHIDELIGTFDLVEYLSKLPKADYYYHLNTSLSSNNIGPIGAIIKSGPIGADSFGPIEPNDESGPIGADSFGPIEPSFLSGPIEPSAFNTSLMLDVSKIITTHTLYKFNRLKNSDPIIIERHRGKICEIKEAFDTFSCNINNLDDMAIISSEASILESKISELIGIVSPEDVLNNIFTNFCIGK